VDSLPRDKAMSNFYTHIVLFFQMLK